MARYHRDDSQLPLTEVAARLRNADLIPSFEPLRDRIQQIMAALDGAGIDSVAALRAALKTPARRTALSGRTNLDPAELTLLRRYVEGWFPKPPALTAFAGYEAEAAALAGVGVTTAQGLLDAAATRKDRGDLARRAHLPLEPVRALVGLVDLTRIQWVAPTFAAIIHAAGYDSPQALAAAPVEGLYDALHREERAAMPGRPGIGRRDVARLVELAAWLPVAVQD